MKRTNVSTAKKHLSALLHEVENGESVLVMSRDRPIARIEPVVGADTAGPGTDRLARLEQLGVVRRPRGNAARPLHELPQPRLGPGVSASAALAEERETGR